MTDMIIKNASYVKGAAAYSQCIVSDLPQIAIAGKSNVGKSSLINYLVNDGKLARTSKLPGRTRLINYFLINDGLEWEFLLADLPGYGFAKVSDAEKLKWADLLENYLAKEQQLKHVFFLVDIRHEPTKDDVIMYNYLFANSVPFTIVATKADKLPKSQVKNRCRAIANFLKVGADNVIPVSSLNKTGKEAVLCKIEQTLNVHKLQMLEQYRETSLNFDYPVAKAVWNDNGDKRAVVLDREDGNYFVVYQRLVSIPYDEFLHSQAAARYFWEPFVDTKSVYGSLQTALEEIELSGYLK